MGQLFGKPNNDERLFDAIKAGNLKEVQRLIRVGGANIEAKNEHGITPLIYSLWYPPNLSITKFLVKAGANLEARTADGSTALGYAVELEPEIVLFLIEAGADIEAVNDYGETPLIHTCQEGSIETLDILIKRGANVNAKNDSGSTSLFYAVERDHSGMVDLFLSNEADISVVNDFGDKAIHNARSVAVAKSLIEHGADPCAIGSNNQTLLQKLRDAERPDAVIETRRLRQELIRFLVDEWGVPDE
jgi:ankyrin repeat protein